MRLCLAWLRPKPSLPPGKEGARDYRHTSDRRQQAMPPSQAAGHRTIDRNLGFYRLHGGIVHCAGLAQTIP